MSDPAMRVAGPTILLGSGSYFDFESPETTPLTIEDVAYGLAYTCRFAGQCVSRATGKRCFYSVAEHCVRISWHVHPLIALDALMHELGEVTCGDMTAPLKSICPDFQAIEKRCESAALAHFGIKMSDPRGGQSRRSAHARDREARSDAAETISAPAADGRKRTRAIRAVLTDVQPGQGRRFKLSGDQPFNRAFYLAVNGVAYALWGAGAYWIEAGRGEVSVFRKPLATAAE